MRPLQAAAIVVLLRRRLEIIKLDVDFLPDHALKIPYVMEDMPMPNYRILAIPFLLLTTAGCIPTNKTTGQALTPKDSEYQCLPVPSKWKEVGSVFSLDSKGITLRLGKVDKIQVLPPTDAGFPEYTARVSIGSKLLLSSLSDFTTSTGASAILDTEASSMLNVSAKYSSTMLQISEGQPEPKAILWFRESGFTATDGIRYFLVRETIQSPEVDYEVQKADLVKLGVEAKFKEVAKANLTAGDFSDANTVRLKKRFPEPVNVCIKPVELVLIGTGATGQILEARPVKSALVVMGIQP
ncbi:hypothetical protein HNP55_001038 [Paucibacter oligotrophus]|uniref:Uncharacterized protein n=1 Tax=Roseateles oligotrophus TaxID=1769250 RepID=A0A840L6V4_9BURK|nr:hypothetical protein [Roseateles oligotrophus]MBB4842523.1 hypothetical protein [Roseateles oligotrophus]